jgi:ankyrin repeat protein
MAAINGHYDAAVFLLSKGADPNLADRTGRTALFSAVDFHTMPQSNRPSPKDTESEESSLDLIKTLLAKGANIDAQLKNQQPYRTKLDRGDDTMLTTGTTPLLRAAKAGDTEVVRLLLAKGADTKLATRAGITPLMAAAGLGTKEEDTTGRFKTEADAIESIKLLLAAGADINAANGQGQTALMGAALKGSDEVVKFLAEHGAKLDAKDKQGRTALDAALGLAGGGGGFDGSRKDVHESTAELLKKLLAATP